MRGRIRLDSGVLPPDEAHRITLQLRPPGSSPPERIWNVPAVEPYSAATAPGGLKLRFVRTHAQQAPAPAARLHIWASPPQGDQELALLSATDERGRKLRFRAAGAYRGNFHHIIEPASDAARLALSYAVRRRRRVEFTVRANLP